MYTFSLLFVYLKEIDMEKLENGQYAISIVMSSSIDGDLFSGALEVPDGRPSRINL